MLSYFKSFSRSLFAITAAIVSVQVSTVTSAIAGSLDLRVAIEENVGSVRVGSSVNALVKNGAGQVLGEIQGMNGFTAVSGGSGVNLDKWSASRIVIEPKDANGVVWIGDRWYRGKTMLVPTGGGLTAVNTVDLEAYLASVLGGEMNGSWHQEALKAQAVAARSYALYRRNRDGNGNFDLCDTARCQVYRGVQDESAGTQAAVAATAGQVLTYRGQIIEALFHSSSGGPDGGATENVEDVWGSQVPYLKAVKDYDTSSPVASWTKTIGRSALGNLVGMGPIDKVEPVGAMTLGKSYKELEFFSGSSRKRVKTSFLRDELNLRSAKISIVPQSGQAKSGDKNARPSFFEIRGNGFGHGLGLSQYGAKAMAEGNYSYNQIVLHYFTGTELRKIDPQ